MTSTGPALVGKQHAEAPDPELNADLPRRLSRRWGPLNLHTQQALAITDTFAGVTTWATAGHRVPSFLLQVVATIGLFAWLRLYRHRLSLNILDDLPLVFGGVVVTALSAAVLEVSDLAQRSRPAQALSAAVFLVLLVIGRVVGFRVARHGRRSGAPRDLALIIGAGHVGIQLATNFQEHTEYGVTPIGYIDSDPRVTSHDDLPAPLLGDYDDLAEVIDDFNVSFVVVAFGSVRESALVDILRTCDRLDVEVFIVPRLFELHTSTRDTDNVWGIPLVRVRRAAFRSPLWSVKRLVDVLTSAVALLLLSPLLLGCAFAVRAEGGRGVIFSQERVGLDGRPFRVLKFRSLRPVDDGESQTQWNVAHDARVGRVGRILRKSSLDELPQLWNILRGDMSLVGPRPERPHFVERFAEHVPRYTSRHRVPAGLTGWAQVHGLRGDTSIEDRARFDNYYIENWSLWLDLKILLMTIMQVIKGAGA